MSDQPNDRPPTGITTSDAVEALTRAMIVWDEESYLHCARTAVYAEMIARELGVDAETAEGIRLGSLLHDIGKMGVELSVLKKPGQLDDREDGHVQLHPEMGASILARVLPLSIVECAAAHHEQPDGGGYPRGLTEEQIPLTALICRIADVFDSLTTPQTYRGAMSQDEAMAELRLGSGTRYSARIVSALIALSERDELRRVA